MDKTASFRKLMLDPLCRACGERAVNCHHLLGRGARSGDDDVDNLIPLCGSGSHGCHGALHGNSYTRAGVRWDQKAVRAAIGRKLTSAEFAYVVRKLGSMVSAEAYLERWYALPSTQTDRVTPA